MRFRFTARLLAWAARRAARPLAAMALILAAPLGSAVAQSMDCARLQQQIAAAGSGGGKSLAAAARKQSIELSRTAAYGHQLGCDRQQFLFFGGTTAPQCGAVNARIAQMQANLGQLQAASGGAGSGREDLIARFNASCRGGQQSAALQPPRQRGFFESLFGSPEEQRAPAPADLPPDALQDGADDDGFGAHGGSQAVCVRTCDGGFFPMTMSVRHNQDSLNEMCTALCPGTQVAVYTRNPNSEIKTAVSLDGTPYMDMPNALKFEKNFEPACTCRPAGKSWAEALTGAENTLGSLHKGDILVTPEKSAELSRPKMDDKTRAALLRGQPSGVQADAGPKAAVDAKPPLPSAADDVTGPDGIRRPVRKVGPQL